MKKLLTFFLVLTATCTLWAGNVITYTASEQLPETTDDSIPGLHTNAFNVAITSHTFAEGTGTLTFSGKVTSIGNYAFFGCTDLTTITIPEGVTRVGSYAFRNCTGLLSITIPESVTSIGNSAFYGCTGLTSIVVASGNTTFDSRDNCNAIIETATNTLIVGCQSTIIPSSVTSIGQGAFRDCTTLTSITIPEGVTSIGNSAFYGCTGLTSLVIPSTLTSMGNFVFNDCSSLTSVTIQEGATTIGPAAFRNCTALISIAIPSSVTRIGAAAFNGVTNVVYSGTATGSPWGAKNVNCYVEGYLVYQDADKTVLCGYTPAAKGEINIPESVTSMRDSVFYGCTGITSVTIPSSVTSIGISAFRNCSALTSITIPEGVTSIGMYAFWNCTSLLSITIPEGVTSIGATAFNGCTGLTSLVIPSTLTSIGTMAFRNCTALKIVYNASALNIVKGETANGYVAYYADKVYTPCHITVASSDIEQGTIGMTLEGVSIANDTTLWTETEVVITAIPATGFRFTSWSDSNTDNPRTITLTEAVSLIGNFTEDTGTSLINKDVNANVSKILRNGQLLIQRDGHVYNMQGARL